MKLIYCLECNDTFSLSHKAKTCSCKNVTAMYVDSLNAIFSSKSENYLMLGFSNPSITSAYMEYKSVGSKDGWGINFDAFIIPEPCKTFKRVSDAEFSLFEMNLDIDKIKSDGVE